MLERRLRNKSNYPHNILWVPSVCILSFSVSLLRNVKLGSSLAPLGQAELLEAAKEFRSRAIPIDAIVQDSFR